MRPDWFAADASWGTGSTAPLPDPADLSRVTTRGREAIARLVELQRTHPGRLLSRDRLHRHSEDLRLQDQPLQLPRLHLPGRQPTEHRGHQGIVIHDIEGTAQDGLNVFQDHNSGVSSHYIVDTDGTIYQCLHEKDIAYQDGNFWSNEHTIGIEHAGFDANGYDWYNATEYLASAQLVAYLLTKYHLPLDRGVVLAHGTVPSPNYLSVNHVDPGPYWLWDYYFGPIHAQGVPYSQPSTDPHLFTLRPSTDQQPLGPNGTETPDNFNFFYLYKGPSTDSGRIPSLSNGTDITDETDNVEVGMSCYYLDKVPDPAGTGDTMYKIWYGEYDQLGAPSPSRFQDAQLAWLAVPQDANVVEGVGTPVTITSANGGTVLVYGDPTASSRYILGSAPDGATFASMTTVGDPKHQQKLWYEIDFNHRQAWVPASDVSVGPGS
ncbi:MAG: N-acetylmuramoyl-L-alanine amidase [Nocardioidaceae bacterium]